MSLERYPNIDPCPVLAARKRDLGSYATVHSQKVRGPDDKSYWLYHDVFYKHGTNQVIVIGLDYPDMTQHKSMRMRFEGHADAIEPYEKLYPTNHMLYIYKFRVPAQATVQDSTPDAEQPAAPALWLDVTIECTAWAAAVAAPAAALVAEPPVVVPPPPPPVVVPPPDTFAHRLTRRFCNKRYNYWIFTMFKHDYNLLNVFCSYYKRLGFDGFTMYNNVPAPASAREQPPEVNDMYNRYNIEFHTWDFDYWLLFDNGKLVADPDTTHPGFRALPNSMQPATTGLSLIHGAQALAMNQWLYKYGDLYDVVFFCDLDEYLCLGKGKMSINEFVTTFNYAYNLFRMAWSDLPDIGSAVTHAHNWQVFKNQRMLTTNKFLPVPERTKFMLRPEHAKCLSIHTAEFYPCDGQACRYEIETARFYHFFKWSGKNRTAADCTFDDKSLADLAGRFK